MGDVKILVMSDSHGNSANIIRAIEKEQPFDILVHCGDVEGFLEIVIGPDPGFEVKAVKGNCDFGHALPIEEEFKAGFCNIWITHGDRYNVKYEENLRSLRDAAARKYADIVLFGHTHYAEIVKDEETGIYLINPGSIGYPQSSSGNYSYAVLKIKDDYEIVAEIKELEV